MESAKFDDGMLTANLFHTINLTVRVRGSFFNQKFHDILKVILECFWNKVARDLIEGSDYHQFAKILQAS